MTLYYMVIKMLCGCALISSDNMMSKAEVCHHETALVTKRLDWKLPIILNAGDPNQPLPGLVRKLSMNSISASVMMADKYRKKILDLSYKIILLNTTSNLDMVANIIQQRGKWLVKFIGIKCT